MLRTAVLAALIGFAATANAVNLGSKHALLIDEDSGAVMVEKNATDIVPIASLTKLMTAMVVLDAHPDMEQAVTITDDDVDMLKHSSSRVPVGASFTRATLLELALMSSDNRAAHALARSYPGGMDAFLVAVRNKAQALGLRRTNIEEPTGLSPHNTSTAVDLAQMAMAASRYPEIERITTSSAEMIDVDGEATQYRNTNRLVGNQGWDILMSKTGFTREAGRCLIMRVRAAGRHAIMVLLNARETVTRTADATNLQHMLTGEPMIAAAVPVRHRKVRVGAAKVTKVAKVARASRSHARRVG
jgi:D-alanyl-D-alanine carboxypeptidase/D-alanyl-D-alanine endopeptidase (penicillin-binding protein 7)